MDTFSEYYLKNFLFYLRNFLVALCLRGCLQVFFSSCGEQELLSSCSMWASHCGRFSCCRAWALGAQASVLAALGLRTCGLWTLELAGSVAGEHGLSCSAARGIFLGQGSNPCPLYGQADSYPVYHQRSPEYCFQTHKIRTPGDIVIIMCCSCNITQWWI